MLSVGGGAVRLQGLDLYSGKPVIRPIELPDPKQQQQKQQPRGGGSSSSSSLGGGGGVLQQECTRLGALAWDPSRRLACIGE